MLIIGLHLSFPDSILAFSPQIIGCVNGTPIHMHEYERLYLSQKARFQESLIFDPWQPSSTLNLQKRTKALEESKRRAIPAMQQEILNYQSLFEQERAKKGDPPNTYDLKSYAAENALLMQFFRQEVGLRLQKSLVEKELMVQEARARRIMVEPIEVETRLQSVKAKYPSRSEYADFLRRNSSTEFDLRYALEEQILIDKLKGALCQVGLDCQQIWHDFLADKLKKSEIAFAIPGSGQSIQVCGSTDYSSFSPAANQYEPDPSDFQNTSSTIVGAQSNSLKTVKKWFKVPKFKFKKP
ncbi:MAG: hypothetical protein SFT81_04385 [Candidatus Caenarcaniphilales bacterium]|nr:hypothetical protein [Candidatus Caenarcaniphilales bacterium]